MAIAFGAAGAIATGTTSLSVAFPTGISAGHLLVLHVVNKFPGTAAPNPPAGWSIPPNAQKQGGSGPSGANSGQVFSTAFCKVADGSESGSLAITLTGGNCAAGRMFRYTGATIWDLFATGGPVSGPDTTWSPIMAGDPGVASGDVILALTASNSARIDFSAPTLAATGATIGSGTERAQDKAVIGNNCTLYVVEFPCSAGAATATPVYSHTNGSAAADDPCGATVLLRIRIGTAVTPSTGSAAYGRFPHSSGRVGRAELTGVAGNGGAPESASKLVSVTTFFGIPTGLVALTGTLAAIGDSSGTLTATYVLAGTIAAVGNTTGTLTATWALSGTIAGAGALTGSLAFLQLLSGTLAGAGTIAGALNATWALSGTLAATGDFLGSLAFLQLLSGTLAGAGALTGALDVAGSSIVALSGTLAALGDTSGALALALALGGTLAGLGDTSGALAMTYAMSGTMSAAGTVQGTVALTIGLGGTLAASAQMSGNMSATMALGGTLAATGEFVGAPAVTRGLVGVLAGAGACVGSLNVTGPTAPADIVQVAGAIQLQAFLAGVIALESPAAGVIILPAPSAGVVTVAPSAGVITLRSEVMATRGGPVANVRETN